MISARPGRRLRDRDHRGGVSPSSPFASLPEACPMVGIDGVDARYGGRWLPTDGVVPHASMDRRRGLSPPSGAVPWGGPWSSRSSAHSPAVESPSEGPVDSFSSHTPPFPAPPLPLPRRRRSSEPRQRLPLHPQIPHLSSVVCTCPSHPLRPWKISPARAPDRRVSPGSVSARFSAVFHPSLLCSVYPPGDAPPPAPPSPSSPPYSTTPNSATDSDPAPIPSAPLLLPPPRIHDSHY